MKRSFIIFVMVLLAVSLAAHIRASYNKTFTDPARNNRQIACVIYYPAELTEGENAIPYIIFGHGWLMNHTMYSSLTNVFVDLGWIVIFPRTEESIFPSHIEFARDLSFLCSEVLTEFDNPASVLFGHISGPAIVMGHSMGGGASVLAAGMENDFAALVTFCAAETDVSAIQGASNVNIPSITFSGSSDTITPPAQHQIPIYNNLASDYKCYVSITGAGHLNTYSNALVAPLLNPWFAYILSHQYSFIQAFENVLLENSSALSYQIENNLIVQNYDPCQPSPDFKLVAFPNPSPGFLNLSYELKSPAAFRLEIFNIKGQKVRCLHSANLATGSYNTIWNGYDDQGKALGNGLYFAKIQQDGFFQVRKLLISK